MKKALIIIVLLLLIVGLIIVYKYFNKKQLSNVTIVSDVVPTMENVIQDDASYCATFQLIWNDLKNGLVKTDIKFEKENAFVTSLNKELFTEDDISKSMYYKVYGKKTLELKKQIEDAIWEKFKQKSDILDKFSWDEADLDHGDSDIERYFFYTMLYKEFTYPYAFEVLDNDTFNDKYNDVKYFGIQNKGSEKLFDQVKVLYYKSDDDFAIKLLTKEDDEIIINVNPSGNTFQEIYDNIKNNAKNYTGHTYFSSHDTLKVPYISLNVIKEYTELENQPFYDLQNNRYEIVQALQSIQFEINEKGGKIKSEAGMDVTKATAVMDPEIRHFDVNKTFAIFLKEGSKDKPYFAAKITDITKYQ